MEPPRRTGQLLPYPDFLLGFAPERTEGIGKVSCWLCSRRQSLAIAFLALLQRL